MRARPPSRTLIDTLAAFADAYSANPSDLRSAEVAEATRDLKARVGRSTYIEASLLKRERLSDPGAWGIKVPLEALVAADDGA